MESRKPNPMLLDPRDMVLSQDDVPGGFLMYEEAPWDNRSAARSWPDPEGWRRSFESWGRLAGYEVSFETEPLGDLIQSMAAVFLTEEGAGRAFNSLQIHTFDNQRRRNNARNRRIVALEEIVHRPLADEAFTLHLRVSGTYLDAQVTGDLMNLTFRRGVVISTVNWRSFPSMVSHRRLRDLAHAQDERVVAALGG